MTVKKLNKTLEFDDYSDLYKTYDYDKVKATRLAEAMTEVTTLEKRLQYLKNILNENVGLGSFLWKTEEGTVIALHDIEDSHLKNILGYITRKGAIVKPEILAEARSRGLDPDDYAKKPILIEDRYEEDWREEWDD